MFARLIGKATLLIAAAALLFFGIGLLGVALALFLSAMLGAAGAYAVAGGAMLVLALGVVGIMALSKPRRPPPPPPSAFVGSLLSTLAKDLPWAAVLSAGLAAGTEMLLKRRHKSKT